MKVDWRPLRTELECWRREGLTLSFWWRDDDAIRQTVALDTLESLSRDSGVPVHLAVVPAEAETTLAEALSVQLIPVMHGWAHRNNAPAGQKKAEFGKGRDLQDARADLSAGIERMTLLFGEHWARMFVPPWNRLEAGLIPLLRSLGFDAVSTYLPRKVAEPVPGLSQINTHIDPIFWRGSRGLVDPEMLVAQAIQLLQDRRAGRADNAEPLGYLTHHLVHDADIWEFSRQFLAEITAGPVTLYRHDRKDTP